MIGILFQANDNFVILSILACVCVSVRESVSECVHACVCARACTRVPAHVHFVSDEFMVALDSQ